MRQAPRRMLGPLVLALLGTVFSWLHNGALPWPSPGQAAPPAALAAPAYRAAEDAKTTVYLPLAMAPRPARPTSTPTVTPVPPTSTATPVTPVEPTNTVAPTSPPATPAPSPTYDVSTWLGYVDFHRSLAGLPGVGEDPEWSLGDQLHARYMVENDVIGHSEDPSKRFYSAAGNEAAVNGNVYLMAATNYYGTFVNAIDGWMTGPFHMLGIIDPRLAVTGFGEYAKDFAPWHRYGATLDVHRGRGAVPEGVEYPVFYPMDGAVMPNLSYDGGESPNPLAACPGYSVPTGPPIALQLGTGDLVPNVTRTSLRRDGIAQAHCWFDEVTYSLEPGRTGLDLRDAVIVMPREKLTEDATYEVTVDVDGHSYTWSFTADTDTP